MSFFSPRPPEVYDVTEGLGRAADIFAFHAGVTCPHKHVCQERALSQAVCCRSGVLFVVCARERRCIVASRPLPVWTATAWLQPHMPYETSAGATVLSLSPAATCVAVIVLFTCSCPPLSALAVSYLFFLGTNGQLVPNGRLVASSFDLLLYAHTYYTAAHSIGPTIKAPIPHFDVQRACSWSKTT